MKEKYDKFQKLPERACGCGSNCGLTFKVTIGQHGRQFAKDCPVAEAKRKAYNRDYHKKRNLLARQCACAKNCGRKFIPRAGRRFAEDCPNRSNSLSEMMAARVPDIKCIECCNMPWRRPRQWTCRCGLWFAPEPALSIDDFATNHWAPERVA